MFSLILPLLFFIASPWILIGVALKSWIWAAVGLLFGSVYVILFFINGFSEFKNELKAKLVDESISKRLQQIWKESGPVRLEARFWVYGDPHANFKVWASNGSGLDLFLSQGFLNLATDSGMRAVFQEIAEKGFSDVKLQNRRHALSSRLNRIKGSSESFRYWFLSFWLYPLEWLLKIAKI